MANRISEVACRGWRLLAILTALSPAAAEFSHREHLAQKIECVVCHSSARASSKLTDNLLPGPALCLNCHTGDRALSAAPQIKTPRSNNLSQFNHALHVKMGNTIAGQIVRAIDAKKYLSAPGNLRSQLDGTKHPCTGCHRGLEVSDSVTPAAFPQMADCLVCHNAVDPPFSCSTCHAESANLKPASHKPDFLDRHTTGKMNLDKTTCAVCHGQRFTCLGCH